MRDYPQLDATEIAGLVRAGHVSQTEVVQAALAEVERQNPALNAVVEVYADEALKAAAALLKDNPDKDKDKEVKKLQERFKTILKNT